MIGIRNYGAFTQKTMWTFPDADANIPTHRLEMYRNLSAVLQIARRFAVFGLFVALFLIGNASGQSEAAPDDAVAIFNQAQDLHEKGDISGAIKLYDRALSIVPDFPEAEYQKGVAYLALGKNTEAESAFRHAVKLRPDWTLAQASLGSLLVNKGAYDESEKLLSSVLEAEPQNPPAIAAMIDLRLRTGAGPAVLKELLAKVTAITGKASTPASLWTTRASLEAALTMPRAAKASLANALAADPKNRNALFQLADIALSEGDLDKANELLIRLDSGAASDTFLLLKANILALEGKYDDALKYLDRMAAPGAPAADLRKRINAVGATDPAELEKQLAVNEKDPVILGRLCSLYRKAEPMKALAYCRRAAEAEPSNVNHAVGFGAALVQAKQFDTAVGVLIRILAYVPDNATARANLATALFQSKRFAEAKEQFEWLAAAKPRSPGAYFFLGIIHDELTEYMDAAANYSQFLRLADAAENKLDIEKVNLRLPQLQKLIKDGKGKKK